MNILQIHNYYQQRGGERQVVEAEAALLYQYGHHVRFFNRNNLQIRQFSIKEKIKLPRNTIYSQDTQEEVNRIIDEMKPDVAHVHNVFPLISPSVYVALKQNKVPIVQTIHNYRLMCPAGLFLRQGKVCEKCAEGNSVHAVIHKCYRNSSLLSGLYASSIGYHRQMGTFNLIDRFICVSKFVASKLIEHGVAAETRLCVVPNFVSDDAFQNNDLVFKPEQYVGYIGRLSEEKGLTTLLRAFLQSRVPCLKIAGTGSILGDLMQETKRLGIKNRVSFLGYLSGVEKRAFLQNALAIVVPSEWFETFGLTVLESYAQKTPVIVSNMGGLSEIVHNGETGFIFDAGNQSELAAKLSEIYNTNSSTEMGLSGYELAKQHYSAEQHYQQLMDVYHQVLK